MISEAIEARISDAVGKLKKLRDVMDGVEIHADEIVIAADDAVDIILELAAIARKRRA